MRAFALLTLFVAVCSAAGPSSCSAQTSCLACQQFTDSVSPGTACDWCVATSSNLNVGCVAAGACPVNSQAVSAGQCSAPVGTCEQQNDCQSCTQRLAPSSTANNPQNCVWCASSYSSNALGCRATCPSNYNVYYANNCPTQGSFGATIAIIVFSASGVLGLLLGSLLFGFTYSSDVKRQQSAAVLLHFFSYVLVGAAPFSAALSMRVSRLTARKCCTCMPFWVYFLSVFEILCVIAGLATGISIEASISYYSYGYTQYNYNGNFGGMFIVMIGIPTAVGGILAFGLPRVCISSCASRRKVKVDDDSHDDMRHTYSDRSPLIDQQIPHHHHSQQHHHQQHHSQAHIAAAQPVHAYPLTPSVNIVPVGAPAGYAPGPMHLQSPPSYQQQQQYPPAPQDYK